MGFIDVFKRSWEITKISFSVIKHDKELILFPLLSGFFSLLFIVAMIVPTIVMSVISAGASYQGSIVELVLLFLVYLGLSFIATFFNVCTVYTAKIRFEGGNATFKDSIKFAFSRIAAIFLWSIVSAVVGVLLRLLENIAHRSKGGGKILLSILRGLLGAAWSIITLFVVPVLVYKGLGPFAAIKESAQTLKKTWGESLIRHFGLGMIMSVVIILEVVFGFIFVLLATTLGTVMILITSLIVVCLIVLTVLVFGIANQIYNTALYVYAETGEIPQGFNQEVLAHAFEKEK